MSEVERFYPKLIGSITFLPDDDGEWVKASDYDALAAELEKWKQEAAKWQEHATQARKGTEEGVTQRR